MITLQSILLMKATRSWTKKSELRQPLFSQPVTHLHMFGVDENESAEKVLKTQATSFNKVLTNPTSSKPRFFKPKFSSSQNLINSFTELSSHSHDAPAGSSRGYSRPSIKPSTSRSSSQPQSAMSGSKNLIRNIPQQLFRASYRGRGRFGWYRAYRRTGTQSYYL